MAEKRVIQFPPVTDFTSQVSADKQRISFTDQDGESRGITVKTLKAAAYAVYRNIKLPEKFLSGGGPTILAADGVLVLQSDGESVTGGTAVAVAQANGSALRIEITNFGTPTEIHTFTFLSGTDAVASLWSGRAVQTTTTPGQTIEVTFDAGGHPILGVWH
jgi:hypothetical protein